MKPMHNRLLHELMSCLYTLDSFYAAFGWASVGHKDAKLR